MKRKVIVGFILLLFSILSTFLIYTKTNKEYIIKKTLENKYYSYLPQEAKEYIEEVYEKTGQIIKTEKNREENVPYLSPKYVEYLALTKEEQKEVSEIPKQYDIYFKISETSDELPNAFNLNADNHITELKNQNPLNLCWAFATVEQVESNLMIKQATPRSLTFSTRQIDYASSTNGIKDYDNENGMRELNSGGNFLISSLILYNGLGLYSDLVMPFNADQNKKEVSEVLNYNNVLYELNSGVLLPTMTNNNTSEEWENYRNKLKQLIIENGGAYVGTQAPGYSCSSKNINNNPNYNNTSIIRVDNCTQDGNHAMQIIGWDDNYDYSYCNAEKEINNKTVYYHSENVSSCSSSNLVTGKGAWLLRNSWGTTESYIYLAYDSIEDDVFVFSDFSSAQNKNWDNNYHERVNLQNLYQTTSETKTFHKIENSEKVEKIKLFTYGQNGEYKISITSKSHNYNNIKQVTIPNMGINTIDLSDKNILINDEEFSVKIESTNGVCFITDTMSIFTSNVSQNSIIKTELDIEDNCIKFDVSNTNYSFRLFSNTKNISSGELVNYTLKDYKGNNENNYLTVQNNIVAINNINTLINLSSEIKPGYHILTINYQGITEDIKILIGDGKVKIHFFANDGTENNMIQSVDILNPGFLRANSFTREEYTFLGWNTKSDGTGINYTDQQELENIGEDLNLYAIWIPNKYTITFDANGGTGEMKIQELTYDIPLQLSENQFVKSNYQFKGWNTKADGTGIDYENNQIISNLNENIILYAQWERMHITITFNPNGGLGNIDSQTVLYGESIQLKPSFYIREGYTFGSWNTELDGSGELYTNNQIIDNITENKNLYAQWIPNKYTITFNANGGIGEMEEQEFSYGIEQPLKENVFTHSQYQFVSWNTKKDGTGIFYQNIQSIINLTPRNNEHITLYAIWDKIPDIYYKTHVQTYGWQDYVSNGALSGTEGQAKRLEAIQIKVLNKNYTGNIEYRTHIQSYGWESSFKKDDEMSGTSGEAKRLEAIEIKLTGELAEHYDVYYRVHAQSFGWLGWAKNGESAGTASFAKRLEGIEIKLVDKDSTFPDYGKMDSYIQKYVEYRTHVQSYGWQDYTYDGNMSGTSGEAKRLEAIQIKLSNQRYSGGIKYRTHIQSYGWQDYVSNGVMSGTNGEAKRLEAIEIALTGEMENYYDVYYRVHAQAFGWMNWAKNGEKAGTAGYAYRLEGIEIVLVEKGKQPPRRTNQNCLSSYVEK